jgi:hypothetical protein
MAVGYARYSVPVGKQRIDPASLRPLEQKVLQCFGWTRNASRVQWPVVLGLLVVSTLAGLRWGPPGFFTGLAAMAGIVYWVGHIVYKASVRDDVLAEARILVGGTVRPEDAAAVAWAWCIPALRKQAEAKLTELLPTVTAETASAMSKRDFRAFARVLVVTSNPYRGPRAALAFELVRILGSTAFDEAIVVLGKVATDVPAFVSPGRRRLRAAVKSAISQVRANIENVEDDRRLLRSASEPNANPDELLRAAGEGETPQEQLLRSDTPHKPPPGAIP